MIIYVYADWEELNGPLIMGTLSVVHTKGHQVMSFEYHKDWIKNGIAQNLDPGLQSYTGPQYLGNAKANFGLLMDSSPDRWGRTIMDRREGGATFVELSRVPKLMFRDALGRAYGRLVGPKDGTSKAPNPLQSKRR